VEITLEGHAQNVIYERGFSTARNAGDASEAGHRECGVDILKVVLCGAEHAKPTITDIARLEFGFSGGDALAWNGNLCRAVEILGGEGFLVAQNLLERPLRNQFPASRPGAGADVEDVVGGADRVLVMLDDDHRVAEISEVAERLDESVVIALVQADAGFVENIQHAGKT
jgi:hypothetical protein